jgi:hypothetical protein
MLVDGTTEIGGKKLAVRQPVAGAGNGAKKGKSAVRR